MADRAQSLPQTGTNASASDECADGDVAQLPHVEDSWGDGCYAYEDHPEDCGGFDDSDFEADVLCCACTIGPDYQGVQHKDRETTAQSE